ncbi:Histidine kinase-, DNA gyrase B-, and HSP90-like ATPase [Cyclonatronum proteinivorum]|uniref:histidine kinase n=1 Tax=Cyclonatronum proteinivorum TaxID=1457365 RepID=A0A345UP79_9BACT|nr:ATP-binding protein [Cyclonatronum proteinivorum]AXJ02281.1 Histidine kinase-, DNA gyrase B-, and HSP90-like ATPase [Cyclonatronum proteinivorum]
MPGTEFLGIPDNFLISLKFTHSSTALAAKTSGTQFATHMEIVYDLELSKSHDAEIDMHSVVNLVSVVKAQLHMLGGSEPCEVLQHMMRRTEKLLQAVKQQDQAGLAEKEVEAFAEALLGLPESLVQAGCSVNDDDLAFYTETIEDIVKVMKVRFAEIYRKWENPDEWLQFQISQFHYDFSRFFGAMEKNSRGRYRIVKNIAAVTEGQDYLLSFEVDSAFDPYLYMPLSVKDVIRDLAANARKYTMPGGTIDIGIMQSNEILRAVVRDSGMGIPADELDKVVQYGYRASNVKDKVRTMGGGFGLTKAYKVVKGLGGRMWISSELNKGTSVKFELPMPEGVAKKK